MTHDYTWLEAVRSVGFTFLAFAIIFFIEAFTPPRDPGAMA